MLKRRRIVAEHVTADIQEIGLLFELRARVVDVAEVKQHVGRELRDFLQQVGRNIAACAPIADDGQLGVCVEREYRILV